jgi:hypothetical protein
MDKHKNLQEFFEENVQLVKDYFETKTNIYKLKAIRTTSKVSGLFIWLIIASFLFFLLLIFVGLVLGFWFSELTGSFVSGFGYATLLLFTIMFLITAFRKQLFIYPLIRLFVGMMASDDELSEKSSEQNETTLK